MVTKNLEDVILKTARESKTLCTDIKRVCREIKGIADRMMTEVKDISQKQDYLINNLRDEYYRLGGEQYADYERDYFRKD